MGAVKILSDKRVRRWPYFDEVWKLDTLNKPSRRLGLYQGKKDFAKSAWAFYEYKYGIKFTAEQFAWLATTTRPVRRLFCLARMRNETKLRKPN